MRPSDAQPRLRRVPLPGGGGEMAMLDLGPPDRAPDVVFSHANGFNARTYRSILAPLAGEMRILAVDLRGHGASTLPAVIEGRAGWSEFRDDLLALLDAVAEHPVVLAGHSMGAITSLLAAAREPARVRSLVLFEPVVFEAATPGTGASPLVAGAARRRASFPSKAAAVEAYLGRGAFRTWSRTQVEDYVEAGFAPSGDGEVTLTCSPAWEASNFRTHNYDPFAALQEVRRPVRILHGTDDSTTRIEGQAAALAATGWITVDVIPGASHFLPMERPELVQAALREAVAAA